MANVIIDDINLSNIANAIREKSGSTDTYKPKDMPQAILDIVSGGSGGEIQVIIPETTVELVTAEGTPLPDGWAMCSAPVLLTETPNLVDGQTYQITIDNTSYDMKVTYHEATGTYLGGNTSLLMDGTDNGEDYIFQLGEFQGSPTLMLFFKGDAGTHTVKLEYSQSEIDEIENLIDESGVLEDTDGTVSEKVEQLIDKAEQLEVFREIRNANSLFSYATTFPSKAVVNLPKAYHLYQTFAYWSGNSIPIVEELTVNAPNIDYDNSKSCMGQMFNNNCGVKKVILNMPDECQYMEGTFTNTKALEEVVLNFSTKNIKQYNSTFQNSTVKKIIGVFDFSSATKTSYVFSVCPNLQEVRFEPNTLTTSMSIDAPNLTSESVQSIIDGLATIETAQTIGFRKSLEDGVRLTDERKAQIEAKGWTLGVW